MVLEGCKTKIMTAYEIKQWKETCQHLSENHPDISFIYDSSEGWCRASYKQKEQKLTFRMSKETIQMALYKLTQ